MITYKNIRYQSIINLIFVILYIVESLISCKISQDNEYNSDIIISSYIWIFKPCKKKLSLLLI